MRTFIHITITALLIGLTFFAVKELGVLILWVIAGSIVAIMFYNLISEFGQEEGRK